MKLYIFATNKDLSAPIINQEAKNQGTSSQILFYENIKLLRDYLLDQTRDIRLRFASDDKIMIRWPWDSNDTSIEYNSIVKYLCEKFQENICLDFDCLNKFSPNYEDKYFQSQVFEKLGVSCPKTILGNVELAKKEIGFPMVIKKRLSSRSKANFLIENEEQLKEKVSNLELDEYVFQKYTQAQLDLRVLVLKDKVLGCVSRHMHVRDENRLSVKGMDTVEEVDARITDDAMKIRSYLGADLVGFDVLVDKKNDYYFIEANLSPQFGTFMQTTGINIARAIIEAIR